MKYFLEKMDGLILSCLQPSTPRNSSLEQLNALFLEIKVEARKCRFDLDRKILSIQNEVAGKKLIQNHLCHLIFLSDNLYRKTYLPRRNKNSGGKDQVTVYFHILSVLERLQQYMLQRYPAYCDANQSVSLFTRGKTIKYFQNNLSKYFSQINSINNELLGIALRPFRNLFRNKKLPLSFSRKEYLFHLMKILHRDISASSEKTEIGNSLMDSLFTMNFNSVAFLNYYTRQIKEDIKSADTAKDQIEKLYFHLKTVNQQLLDTTLCFNPRQTNVKDFISQWILEEICFLEKQMILLGNPAIGQQLIDHNFKIVTELSVAQVACFIRLLVESGVIKNKNRKELITFYAVYTQSKKQENISPDSFRMRFYNIEESARLEIRSTIIQLLNHINHL